MRRLVFTIILLWCATFSFSQTRKLDSLRALVKTMKDDTSKCVALCKISDKLNRLGIYDTAIQYANAAKQLSEKINFTSGTVLSVYYLGNISYNLSKYSEARRCYLEALKLSEKLDDKNMLASINNSLGNTYKDEGNYPVALSYYLTGLKIWEKMGYTPGISVSHNNLGTLYLLLENYPEALKHHFECEKIEKQRGTKGDLGSTYGNIGNVYWNQGNFKEALHYHNLSKASDEQTGDKKGVCYSYVNIGCIYHDMGNQTEALKNFFAGLTIAEELGDDMAKATAYLNISSSYGKLKNYKEAYTYGLKSVGLANEINDLSTARDAYLTLSEIYSSTGKPKEALENYRSYITLRDSLINEENTGKLIRLQVNYEFEKKQDSLKAVQDIKDAIAAEQNKVKDLELSRSKYITYSLTGLVCLIALISLLIIRQNKLRNAQRSMQLEQKLLRSQMNPHFIFNSLSAIESFIYTSDPRAAGRYLSSFARLMRMILENSREEFIPLEKEIKTLELYLELQKLRFEEKFTYSIKTDENIDIENTLIPPMLAQPFIENAIEHGIKNMDGNGLITIGFHNKEKEIIFSVEDNGVGMQRSTEINEQKQKHRSLATTITNERLALLNKGRRQKIKLNYEDLKDESQKASGTRISFVIPFIEG